MRSYFRQCLFSFLLLSFSANSAETGSLEINTAELEAVRDRIQDISSDITSAKTQYEKLQAELKLAEVSIGEESLKLKKIDEKIKKRKTRLNHLNKEITIHKYTLKKERTILADQVRSAYMAGRGNYLKLLLNQEDPDTVGRVLAYYDYYNRARIESINQVKDQVDLVNSLKSRIESETDELEKLKSSQLTKNRDLNTFRESRKLVLKQLESDIHRKDLELQKLLEEEQKLFALINQLEKKKDKVIYRREIPPFNTLKGKLDWPASGKLMNRYGARRKVGNLKWQGIKISAEAGNDVRAVHTGKVLFANWFRNLGLLIILDHGEGYMSLYGYNQSLLKKPGDWVLAGETIAYAGNSGGQRVPGVYFEIRHNGKPLDPSLWCKR
ncbi:MAG: peptidoglycan DD-metalloendopeptidase family protein [Gammaproteobacteria bacterium]|nr:peptidoglycan DD-metalloendopeptidase family protein [Gammaproteobacteria bacterium]NIN62952.1 peptidoglycan DD-metalloendopeptidase family protein [Gammaproteobacteria bacterium]NIO63933.1 peptidoglycan DD-metalloendopeptidase family protein [Gammaproteobacteria bacterium]NIP50311.1 peptidoglycan DD-metalloendopeptidase family protein [Gammaproteobacteria bacterium]NIQ12531.1 peptidoglycan DD-metalloendopeptidase family protein [Gammaproteobacteria bacterium]